MPPANLLEGFGESAVAIWENPGSKKGNLCCCQVARFQYLYFNSSLSFLPHMIPISLLPLPLSGIYLSCTGVTDVNFGKMTIRLVYIGCTRGTPVPDVKWGK